jgi:hypothetical protein
MDAPPIASNNLAQPKQETLSVLTVRENDLPTIAPGHDVIDRSGVLMSQC